MNKITPLSQDSEPTSTTTKSYAGLYAAAAVALALVLLTTLLAVIKSYKSPSSQQFSTPTYPFSFSYPDGWTTQKAAGFAYGSGDNKRSALVVYKNPFDQVAIVQYKLNTTLPSGVNGNQKELDSIVARLTKQSGGSSGEAKVVHYGGIPGYQYVVEYPSGNTTLTNTLTFLFNGNDEFQVTCQYSPPNKQAVTEGCNQILDSLEFQ